MSDFVEITRGTAPLVIGLPHTGTELAGRDAEFALPWLARFDTDWWVDRLYGFAAGLGATLVRTRISRSVIDVNRDPDGASLYPGMTTTGLCPTETFDGAPLYAGAPPDAAEIARRRAAYFAPYHAALASEIARLRARHPGVVLYDAHAIRSRVPRLFAGELPQFNIGTDGGTTCAPALAAAIAKVCAASGFSHVVNGRFRGGWTTRYYGQPAAGIHAIQMELAMRGFMAEPDAPSPADWPTPLDPAPAIAPVLHAIIEACLAFARKIS